MRDYYRLLGLPRGADLRTRPCCLGRGLQGIAATPRRPSRTWAGVGHATGEARRSWMSTRRQTSGARMSPSISKGVIQNFFAMEVTWK